MPEFRYHHPASAEDAVAQWHDAESAMFIAGGTDLLPNLKHRLFEPTDLVGLSGLPRPQVVESDEAYLLDGGLTLHALASHPGIQRDLAPLAQAAGVVAGPQIRRMGTIGGNILLDTRCLFYNQTEFWREALGYCLKKDGTWCHVVGGPKTCVAAQSSDTVPVLLALDATIELLGPKGTRELALRDLYQFNGMDHLSIEPGELLTRVRVPKQEKGFVGTYLKLRTRESIDFPQLGLAVTATFSGKDLSSLDIVVGAVNPKPKGVRGLEAYLGKPLDAASIESISAAVVKQTRPSDAIQGGANWRRAMSGIYTTRALKSLLP